MRSCWADGDLKVVDEKGGGVLQKSKAKRVVCTEPQFALCISAFGCTEDRQFKSQSEMQNSEIAIWPAVKQLNRRYHSDCATRASDDAHAQTRRRFSCLAFRTLFI